jgi:adenosylcobinamide-GDP ribazoletransferase
MAANRARFSLRETIMSIPLEIGSALALLTRLPIGAGNSGRTGSAMFGMVGAGLGALAGAAAIVFGSDRTFLGAASALAVPTLVSGALHLDGLADVADALAAPNRPSADRARRPAIGAGGAVAVALILLVDAAALAALPVGDVFAALVIAGSVLRAVPAVAAPWARRGQQGFGAWFAAHSGRGGAAAALATRLAFVLLATASGRRPAGSSASPQG